MLEYLPHVDTAREALQFLTNSDTTFVGRFNFSKVEGVYPPIPVYLGSCTTLIEDLTPGATLVQRIIIKMTHLKWCPYPEGTEAISQRLLEVPCLDWKADPH